MQKVRKCCQYACVAILVLAGCAGEPVIPVSDLTSPRGRYEVRIVRPGDTLYMIAWEAGLDYRQLADWNSLASPYRITRGMRIRLSGPARPNTGGNGANQTRETALSTEGSVATTVAAEVASGVSVAEVKIDALDPKYRVSQWLWPANGPIIQNFTGKNGNNGVDISGRKGARIRAAADGVVVYAGSGLRGYGRLLIIQHNDVFLSAYAHNQALLVGEGTTVRIGQTVAEMGSSDAESPRLHFEIRLDGAPVNPVDYLPDRS
jgi:lipoprotein NlpD